jgi:hypothetical protein
MPCIIFGRSLAASVRCIARSRLRSCRRLLHHRCHVCGTCVHQFHGLGHGSGQLLIAGQRLDLAFPQIDIVPGEALQVRFGRIRLVVRFLVVSHDFTTLFAAQIRSISRAR